MKVKALQSFSPDGVHRYAKNQIFEIADREGRALVALGRVEFVVTHEPEPEVDAVEFTRTSRHKRRDMRAAD